MGLRINHNIAALNTFRNLTKTDKSLAGSLEKLSSGYRINRASDDVAGLAISQSMRAQIVGLQQASRNASEATNLIQTAEGAANEIHAMLTRMRELAVQAASGNVSNDNRTSIDNEAGYLQDEIDRIANTTKYNGVALINGDFGPSSWASDGTTATAGNGISDVQISGAASGTYTFVDAGGDDELTLGDGTTTQTVSIASYPGEGETVTLNFSDLGVKVKINAAYCDTTGSLDDGYVTVTSNMTNTFQIGADNGGDYRLQVGINSMQFDDLVESVAVDLSTQTNAQSAIATIDTAIENLSSYRGTLGASQNRLSYTISSLDNTVENIQASESTIRDVDMALEMTNFSRAQIMSQAGTSMLAQANSLPQNVLSLFR
ncbi:flagellin [Candidatus Poribacteria bacterium]|nr:flagellin [Candidatus Poribacteria bacterium]